MKKFDKPIYITKPLIPDKGKIYQLFDEVIDSCWLTNMGAQHNLLECELANYLDTKQISVFNNGTIALITALKALNLPEGSEVITTPFTFAATPHSISWNGLKVVFADIDKDTMTLCPEAIKRAITPNTSAILPVHVYGFPCDVLAIKKLADQYDLKVLYDGAHSFATTIDGVPISNYGEMTALSFHSTKLFNSIEGGAIITNDKCLQDKIYELRNFGIKPVTNSDGVKSGIANASYIQEIGINGKMNELQAAWGRVVLTDVDQEKSNREMVAKMYQHELAECSKSGALKIPQMPDGVSNSRQYFPVLFNEVKRDNVYEALLKNNVYSRKYFYPLCSEFGCYNDLPSSELNNLPVAHNLANRVLCLPFYGELADNEGEVIREICRIIKKLT